MTRARTIATALEQLRAALPGCRSIALRDRDAEPGAVLHLEAADETAAQALAATLGIDRVEQTRTARSSWITGSTVEGDLYVLVTGPVRDLPRPVRDEEIAAACAEVAEAGGRL